MSITIDKIYLTDIYWIFHRRSTQYILFSSTHGTFFRINHILHHKTSLGKYEKTEIIPKIFSDHNQTIWTTNGQRRNFKNYKITWHKWKQKHNIQKLIVWSKSGIKREISCNKRLHYKRRKISNNLNLHLNKKKTKPKVRRKKKYF